VDTFGDRHDRKFIATAVHRGRGYILLFVSPTMNAAAADYRTYEAGRRSFRFTRK
jgi:hypothetical protein